LDNVNKVVQNQQNIQDLHQKTVVLNDQSKEFKTQSRSLRRYMWLRDLKFKIIIGLVIGIVIVIIIIAIAVPLSQKAKN